MRVCDDCGVEKSLDEFHLGSTNRGGRRPNCAHCYNARRRELYSADRRRAFDLKRRYGITPGEYDALLEAQGGLCAICRSSDPTKGHAHFVVDHDHATGEVRGLLCHTCNRVIGMFKDDVARLRAAADYVEAAKCRA